MTNLPNDIASLKALIQQLLEENAQLKAENAELRQRLEMNSTNSHKPPSSDGYQKQTTEPALAKPKGRKSGGQVGHQGNTLERVEQPDHIQIHLPSHCFCCGRPIAGDEEHPLIGSRQVFDLPEPKLEITEHRVGQICCCGHTQAGDYPHDVNAAVQYGANVRALITKLSIDHRMPLKQISQLFADTYGYAINSATIEDALKHANALAEPLEQLIIQQLQEAEVVHFDETGVRVAGKLHWLHVASTDNLTHLFLHEKRGAEALNDEASVLNGFHGIAVHDCWASYFQFDEATHVLCGAHLLRELYSLWEKQEAPWAGKMHTLLLELYHTPPPIEEHGRIRQRYRAILDEADRYEPPSIKATNGQLKSSKGRNLMNRLRQHEDGVLAFAFSSNIPFTNNQAERDLRPVKVKQKVSGCFRTRRGANIYARLQAVISTFRKQDINVFQALRDLFLGASVALV